MRERKMINHNVQKVRNIRNFRIGEWKFFCEGLRIFSDRGQYDCLDDLAKGIAQVDYYQDKFCPEFRTVALPYDVGLTMIQTDFLSTDELAELFHSYLKHYENLRSQRCVEVTN